MLLFVLEIQRTFKSNNSIMFAKLYIECSLKVCITKKKQINKYIHKKHILKVQEKKLKEITFSELGTLANILKA